MRRIFLTLGVLGAFGLAACQKQQGQSDQNQQQPPVQSAQNQAQQQLDQARSAQKEANKQEQQAESAQQNVQKEQQKLSEAEQNAQQKTQQAQQAQQNAKQQGQQALSSAQNAQQQAAQMQQQRGPQEQQASNQGQMQAGQQPGQPGMQTDTGQLAQVGRDQITIQRSAGGQPLQLQVNDATQVTIDGQQAGIDQLEQGQQIRASYTMVQNQPTAVRIEANAKSRTGQGGSGTMNPQGSSDQSGQSSDQSGQP